MSKQSLDEYQVYQFVSAAYHAQCAEDEAGIGMSWADFDDSDGSLEEIWNELSEKKQKKLKKAIKKAASDRSIQQCFSEMGDLIDSDEEDMERMRELQQDAMDLACEYFEDLMK